MTIPANIQSPAMALSEASELALAALGWILDDMERAERLLALTGLTPETLRSDILTAHVQSAVLEFLANHEPDLLAASEALAVAPAEMIAAQQALAS